MLAHELADGFTVGSHSVTHRNLKNGDRRYDRQGDRRVVSHAFAKWANRPIGLFRPPYGALSGAGRHRLTQLGVTEVIWSIDTLEWKAHDARKLRAKVLSMILAQNGGIVLMHDVKPITAKIIADVLDDLEAENCRRLAANEPPIWPVSLHYFLRDDKKTPRRDPRRRAETDRRVQSCLTWPPGEANQDTRTLVRSLDRRAADTPLTTSPSR